ncbi:MAG: glycosyltransferase [Patescibacteria group bacterium]|nr:glycosyltransferase [Patescibacteria group bacterium]
MPKVSIILSTYNGSQFIERAIKSVLAQSFNNFELIIVDDGSTDNTFQIINQWAKKDHRIVVLKNKKNLGIQQSANRGLKEAQGALIARLDDDDEWLDCEKLRKQVEFLEKNPDYVLVGTKAIIVDKNYRELYRINQTGLDEEIRKKILRNNLFLTSTILFRKEAILKLGGYSEKESERYIEDYDLILKLGTIGKIAILNFYGARCLHHHRISRKYKKEQLRKSLVLIKKYRFYYSGYFKAFLIRLLGLIIYGFLGLPLLAVWKNKILNIFKIQKNAKINR